MAQSRERVEIFAILCGGFAVMDNHLHLILGLDSTRVQAWPDEEVARRWLTLLSLRDVTEWHLPVADTAWVTRIRGRPRDLSGFMGATPRLPRPLPRPGYPQGASAP